MKVSLRRDHRLAVVEIADTGTGIPATLLPRIFDLYFTTKPKGSGIGLAMTYRILQLHGGAMEVRSNADPESAERGTTFTLRIPMSVAGNEGRKQQPQLSHGVAAREIETSAQTSNGNPTANATRMERKEIA